MSANIMRFKARIKTLAKEEGIPAQVVLQNFMFERFFARLSKSTTRENLILKGGTLISQYLGISRRTTMDIDVTLRNAPLSVESVMSLVNEIFTIDLNDGISWSLHSISPIRGDDQYGGFRVRIDAALETIAVPFSIDVSSGDAITPAPEDYFFKSIFDLNKSYRLKAYTIETVLAEKIEAILFLGTLSTRPRDYYDVFMLTTVIHYSTERLASALQATVRHRGSKEAFDNWKTALQEIENSKIMNSRWVQYQQQFSFAKEIGFAQVCRHIRSVLADLSL